MSYTFTPNKSYGYLLNVKPNNLVFLKTYKTDFEDITISFTDQNGWPLEINLTLLIINRDSTLFDRTKNKKVFRRIWNFVIWRKPIWKIRWAIIGCFKNLDHKVADEAAGATGEFIGNKIGNKIVKQKPVANENLRNFGEIIIPPEQRKRYWIN